MKPPTDFTIEEVVESLTTSLTDHDVGWASIEHAPVFYHKANSTEEIRSFLVIKPVGYNRTDKKFKITVEEA